ncbi:hypothetical protein ACP275_10G101200 [Erythranthe tilingii]
MESKYSPGYRFVPTDEELTFHYLLKKINNQPLPTDVIQVVNFSDHGPDTLTCEYPPVGHKEWYFFTPRIRKYAKGSRPNRTAGNGFWKASCADKDIKFNDKIIGRKMTLVFHEGISSKDGIKTDWIMHEYTAIHPSRNKRDADDNMKLDDWVICRIHKNVSKSSSANKRRANLLENQQQEEQVAVRENRQEEEEQVAVRENRGEEQVEVVASGVREVVEAHDNLIDQYYYGINNNNINAAANSNANANANAKDDKEEECLDDDFLDINQLLMSMPEDDFIIDINELLMTKEEEECFQEGLSQVPNQLPNQQQNQQGSIYQHAPK